MDWTPEMRRFLADNQEGITRAELTEKFNARFGLDVSRTAVHSACKRYGLRNGRDARFQPGRESPTKGRKVTPEQYARMAPHMFQKGQKAANHKPVGSRTWRNVYGGKYEFEKVSEPDKWEFVHRLNWERAYGPVPKGSVVIFIDGDPAHNTVDNLMLETKAQHVIKNRWYERGYDRETHEVLQTMADLKSAICQKRTKHGRANKPV